MTVDQLREILATIPGHIPVHVAVDTDNRGCVTAASMRVSGADTEYLYTLDCAIENFPSQGRMAVITINYEPK